MKEEMVLFPNVMRMEEAVLEKSTVLSAPFGNVRNPVAGMLYEHDGAGQALREMRAAGKGYIASPDTCASYRSLVADSVEMEFETGRAAAPDRNWKTVPLADLIATHP
jgi:iron-sulfur cluster repair protein YtfE (RIC family)